MTITREHLTINFENGDSTMGICVATGERILYIPIEVKMGANKKNGEFSRLYKQFKKMYPSYKEVIIW